MAVNFEKLIQELVSPLVVFPEDLLVKKFSEDEDVITLQVLVNKDDLGRVSARAGKSRMRSGRSPMRRLHGLVNASTSISIHTNKDAD